MINLVIYFKNKLEHHKIFIHILQHRTCVSTIYTLFVYKYIRIKKEKRVYKDL